MGREPRSSRERDLTFWEAPGTSVLVRLGVCQLGRDGGTPKPSRVDFRSFLISYLF